MQGTHKDKLSFPVAISSSQVDEFHRCPTRWYWKYLREQRPKGVSIHLHAGAAFATGLEAARRAFYVKGATQEEAVAAGVFALIKAYGPHQPPEEESKKWNRMTGALVNYFDRYPFATDVLQPWQSANGPAIEFSFGIPLPVNHPETGEPILYTGRLDMLGQTAEKNIWCTDEKTTKYLGSSWADQWGLRGQFMGYTWGVQQHGIPAVGAWVRGVCIHLNDYQFAETPVMFSKQQIKTWYEQTVKTAEKMIEAWQKNWYDQVFGFACHQFSGCDSERLCKSADPEIWLPTYYERYSYSSIRGVEEAHDA